MNYVKRNTTKVTELIAEHEQAKAKLNACETYMGGVRQDLLKERDDLTRRIKKAKKYIKGNKFLKDFTEKDLLAILSGEDN